MKPLTWALGGLLVLSFAVAGCGGGWQQQKPATVTTTPTPAGKPTKAVLQWGSQEAKVRLVGFFYISEDPPYPKTAAVFESLAQEYPKQLFVQYWDLRTPEGQQARAGSAVSQAGLGLLINDQSEITITGKTPRTISFSQEMGRYWTEDDLREAIAQTVQKEYGK